MHVAHGTRVNLHLLRIGRGIVRAVILAAEIDDMVEHRILVDLRIERHFAGVNRGLGADINEAVHPGDTLRNRIDDLIGEQPVAVEVGGECLAGRKNHLVLGLEAGLADGNGRGLKDNVAVPDAVAGGDHNRLGERNDRDLAARLVEIIRAGVVVVETAAGCIAYTGAGNKKAADVNIGMIAEKEAVGVDEPYFAVGNQVALE
jgi:hypothetical protein